jgi:hypothetical protein
MIKGEEKKRVFPPGKTPKGLRPPARGWPEERRAYPGKNRADTKNPERVPSFGAPCVSGRNPFRVDGLCADGFPGWLRCAPRPRAGGRNPDEILGCFFPWKLDIEC